MDNAEHAEDSSFPNVNISLTSIKKRATGMFDRIELSDGSSFLIHPKYPPPFPCIAGADLSPRDVEALAEASETGLAWEKALYLLERRSHSRQELKLKLLKKRFSDDAADTVLQTLAEKNLLNDAEFAEQWILSRLSRHPEGYYALLAGLLRKGVAGEQAEAVLSRTYSEEEALKAARRVREKGERKGKSGRDLELFLKRKGFRRGIIQKLLSEE